MTTRDGWSKAYARQAQADFNTWTKLQTIAVPECHRLLLLQMACEKLTKAHLCAAGADPQTIQSSHAYIAKNVPTIIRQLLSLGYAVKNPRWVLASTRHLATEIELLAPAVKRGGQRPDNCEYPWEDDAGQLHSPLDWMFAPSRLLASPAGRTFLKLLQTSIQRLL
jgi:hypothetical protein